MLSLAKLQGGTGASYCLAQAQSRVTHAESVSSRVEDYHLADPEEVGQWTGGGLAALELGGEVAEEALMRLLDRQDPRTGEPLPRPPGRPPEVDGFDLIFSVPKSASVLFALGDTPKAPSCVVLALWSLGLLCVAVGLLAPASAGAITSAQCAVRVNDTPSKLVECIQQGDLSAHMDNLQAIANDYLKQRQLETARCEQIIREKAAALLAPVGAPPNGAIRPAFGGR